MSDDRPIAYQEGDKIIYRASAVGGCSRALWLARQGVVSEPPNATLQKAFDEGNEGEDRIIEILDLHDWRVTDRQIEYEIQVFGNVYIRCHPDGIASHRESENKAYVFEAKAFAKSTHGKWLSKGFDAFPYYAAQVTVEMRVSNLPCLFVIGVKDERGKVATYDPYEVDQAPMEWGAIVKKLHAVEQAVEAAEMPACDVANDWGCGYWPYEEKVKEVGSRAEDPEALDRIISNWKAVKGQLDELAAREKQLRAQMQDAKGLAGDKWVNSWVKYMKKGSIDWKKMAEDGVDVEKYRKPDVEVSYPQPKPLD